jgi:hypothetical protein
MAVCKVFVPSRSRYEPGLARTVLSLYSTAADGIIDLVLVVPREQEALYRQSWGETRVEVWPTDDPDIAHTRGTIHRRALDEGHDCYCQFDDDLKFFYRDPENPRKLYGVLTPPQYRQLFETIVECSDEYAHGALSMRVNNAFQSADAVECTRACRAHWYVPRIVTPLYDPDEAPQTMDDFYTTLRLLTHGYKNLVLFKWAQDQRQTQDVGGASDYRTHETHAASAKRLQQLWPDFVTLVEKSNVTGGDFGSRLEVRVDWLRAWQAGARSGHADPGASVRPTDQAD